MRQDRRALRMFAWLSLALKTSILNGEIVFAEYILNRIKCLFHYDRRYCQSSFAHQWDYWWEPALPANGLSAW
jgi:hypothetical protein